MRAAGIAAAVGLLLASVLAFGQPGAAGADGGLEAIARSAAEGDAEALRVLSQSADGGHAVAQHYLGLMHL